MIKRDVHAPGRPVKYMSPDEAEELLKLYETHSTRQLAEKYNVSQSAICKRLKKARGVANG